MTDPQTLRNERLANWGQTPATSTPDLDSATALIARLGLVTLYPVSPELPNLLHAYTGDPTTQAASDWDSASGHVYTWRWELGRREAGFYTAIVRGRPTFVAWPLLPAILRLRGDLRDPEELYDLGQLSNAAYRIAVALTEAGGVLDTGTLRRAAGFPTGKEQRAVYLKAVAELDAKLLLAKVFSPDDQDMRHILVQTRYPEHVAAAEQLTRDAALDQFLTTSPTPSTPPPPPSPATSALLPNSAPPSTASSPKIRRTPHNYREKKSPGLSGAMIVGSSSPLV
ncbi:MAG: hypothetical protein U0841_20445 [Chloroflexia bacterium]